jgi:hypothetical protein
MVIIPDLASVRRFGIVNVPVADSGRGSRKTISSFMTVEDGVMI